mgnify:FL=1
MGREATSKQVCGRSNEKDREGERERGNTIKQVMHEREREIERKRQSEATREKGGWSV